MHPGGFPAFLGGRKIAVFQIWGNFPEEKLRLKMSSSSCLALGPWAPLVRIWRIASLSSSFRKTTQQLSPAVDDISVDFSCRMRFVSFLLNRERLTAAYSFINALALPYSVVKVRTLCSRGSANLGEEGVPDSDLIVLYVRAGSRLQVGQEFLTFPLAGFF